MRIIKTLGRSVTEADTSTTTTQTTLSRRLIPNAKARQGEIQQSVEIADYLTTNEQFFLAQWGSIFDKMFNKHDKPYQLIYDTRKDAGNAIWNYWLANANQFSGIDFSKDAMHKKWLEYVHPYDKNHVKDNPDAEEKKPKPNKIWFEIITGYSSIDEVEDWSTVAEAVYQHLYHKQKKQQGKRYDSHNVGLIENRTRSIANNARNYGIDDNGEFRLLANDPKEQNYIDTLRNYGFDKTWDEERSSCQLSQLVEALSQLETDKLNKLDNDKKPKNNKVPYLTIQEAMSCLNQHYGEIFGTETTIQQARQQYPELWAYHCIIKEALRQRYPKRLLKSKKNRGLPKITEDILHNLAVSIERNRLMNFAIRLGKVIHYEAAKQSDAAIEQAKRQSPNIGDNALNQRKIPTLKLASSQADLDIAKSDYWTSKGQTEIKQKEAFVRHFLSAIAIANTSLERLIDPTGEIYQAIKDSDQDGDFLLKAFNTATSQLAENQTLQFNFDKQSRLLFGENHTLYDCNNPDERIEFISTLRQTLANLRHASFHFSNIENFLAALDEGKQNIKRELHSKIQGYIAEHQQKQREQLINTLEAAHVEYFLREEQIEKLINLLAKQRDSSLLTLPRFNRLLQRAEDISQKIIESGTQEKHEKPTYHCSFICLKMLYESDFRHWLEHLPTNTLNIFADKAIKRAETVSDKLGKTTKMSRLRKIANNESLNQYFAYIAQESATEASLQQSKNRYQSDKEGAKAHSNFVDNFKQDFLIYAFHHYLSQRRLLGMGNWLKTLATKNFSLNQKKADIHDIANRTQQQIEALKRPLIYLVLHLMPIEFINHLSLQIKKQHVLTGNQRFSEINQAISLYLDVHNASLNIRSLSEEDELMAFYQTLNNLNSVSNKMPNMMN